MTLPQSLPRDDRRRKEHALAWGSGQPGEQSEPAPAIWGVMMDESIPTEQMASLVPGKEAPEIISAALPTLVSIRLSFLMLSSPRKLHWKCLTLALSSH